MNSLTLALLIHWRIQRAGCCICDNPEYKYSTYDANEIRRWCIQDVVMADQPQHREPWPEAEAKWCYLCGAAHVYHRSTHVPFRNPHREYSP